MKANELLSRSNELIDVESFYDPRNFWEISEHLPKTDTAFFYSLLRNFEQKSKTLGSSNFFSKQAFNPK